MPSRELVAEYERSRAQHVAAAHEMASLLERMALATVVDVLPGAALIEAVGELSEDWIPTLRVQRVKDVDGTVLFDTDVGHPDRAVEDAVDAVNIEYLDVLIDLTGDEYMGASTIG